MSKVSRRDVERTASDVVERARAGDQVAMGLMAQVRDRAKQGNPRAVQSLRAMQRYIAKNPPVTIGKEASGTTSPLSPLASKAIWTNPTPKVVITALPMMSFWQGVVALVHGPRLDNERVVHIADELPGEAQPTFKAGVTNDKAGNQGPKTWLMGRIVGIARCIQRLQVPSVPISTFCPATAWELGE